GKIGSEKAIPALITALGDEDYLVRQSAAEALGKIGSEEAVSDLIKALGDEDSHVCQSAAKALGKIGSEKAIPALITALGDEDYLVRQSAAEALGKIGSKKAIPALITALGDEDSHVCQSAAKALDKLKWIPQTEEQKIPYLIAKQDWKALVEIGQPAISALIEALKDKELCVVPGSVVSCLDKLNWKPSTKKETILYNEAKESLQHNEEEEEEDPYYWRGYSSYRFRQSVGMCIEPITFTLAVVAAGSILSGVKN
ncbi:unnamed protein product, partial [marine sediment metagenome]